ncbi:hypothetical protein [Hydrogenivirga sp.]
MSYERAWVIGEMVGRAVLAFSFARAFVVLVLALHGISFAQTDLGIDPGCAAAKKVSAIWGLIQVGVSGAVGIGLLIASVGAFIERRGAWAGILFFASFIMGGILWVLLDALGNKIEDYAGSCEGGV